VVLSSTVSGEDVEDFSAKAHHGDLVIATALYVWLVDRGRAGAHESKVAGWY